MANVSCDTNKWSWYQHFRIFWLEGQRTISWTWLLPLLIIALSIILARRMTPIPDTSGLATHTSAATAAVQVTPTPDYAATLRNNLELYLPLVSIFLAVPPLAREWQYGTVLQLLLRKSLQRVLIERLGLILLYFLIIVCIAAIASLVATTKPPDNGAMGLWIWDVLRTVAPTTLFCTSLAVLATIATVNVAAGYLTVVGFWGINLFAMQTFAQRHNPKSDFLLYTLNGWQTHNEVAHPDQWWIGKVIWLGGSILCLLMTLLILRFETRLLHNTSE